MQQSFHVFHSPLPQEEKQKQDLGNKKGLPEAFLGWFLVKIKEAPGNISPARRIQGLGYGVRCHRRRPSNFHVRHNQKAVFFMNGEAVMACPF